METEENYSQGENNTEVESRQEPEPADTPTERSTFKFGPVAIVILAVACFLVILWVVYLAWNQPEPAEPPVSVEPAREEVEFERDEPQFYFNRNTGLVGVVTDPTLGRFLVVPQTAKTLYTNKVGDCLDDCLDDWTPYTTDNPVDTFEELGLKKLDDESLYQFTWQGKALYTYNADSEGSVLGDGYEGTWRIARP